MPGSCTCRRRVPRCLCSASAIFTTPRTRPSKRIRVARVAREFPAIFESVADGRLSLTAVVQIAPHLTAGTAGDVIRGRGPSVQDRDPAADRRALPPAGCSDASGACHLISHIERPTGSGTSCPSDFATSYVPASRTGSSHLHASDMRCSSRSTGRWLRGSLAQRLLSHQLRPGDISGVIKRALQALVPPCWRSASSRRQTTPPWPPVLECFAPRPIHVKNAVWVRDGGQCTFVSESGQRCPSRTLLEFDHVLGVARGGRATVAGIRLLCVAIISTRRSARSEPSSWSASVRRRAVSRRAARRNGRQPLAARIR